MKIQQAIRANLKANCTIVVAVSGGLDSMALLHALIGLQEEMQLKLVVAHANHGLRGAESDAESEFVRRFTNQYDLPFESKRLQVAEQFAKEAGNVQAIAREQRYAFFKEVAERWQAAGIVLAHHADDAAETALMKIIRGTGSRGLLGLGQARVVNGVRLLRPLLDISKEELVLFCKAEAIPYMEDSSNASDKYARNALRHIAAPLFRHINPKWVQAVNRYSTISHAEEKWMEAMTSHTYNQYVQQEGDQLLLDRRDFLGFPLALQRRLITLILSYLLEKTDAISFDKIEIVREAIEQQNRKQLEIVLSEQVKMIREYEQLRFATHSTALECEGYLFEITDVPMDVQLPDGSCLVFQSRALMTPSSEDDHSITIDLDVLKLPLFVRTRKTGDRILLSGMSGRKSIKKWFIEQQIPLRLRNQIPIICDRFDQPIWVPGLRPSSHGRVDAKTVNMLHIRYIPFIK